jgi:thiamine biosynthesis protein ThiI
MPMDQYIIRFSPEISIKSQKVKTQFLKVLAKNIKSSFVKASLSCHLENLWSYFLLETPKQNRELAVQLLGNIFGIYSFSLVDQKTTDKIEDLYEKIVPFYVPLVDQAESFCVRIKRSGTQPYTSIELEKELGGRIGRGLGKVSLNQPELKILGIVRQNESFFFHKSFAGLGGFPVGASGEAVALVSGGYDSIVAAYYVMKRGVKLHFLFCNLGGPSEVHAVANIARVFTQKYSHGLDIQMSILDFEKIKHAIADHIEPKFAQIILKRYFYRAAEKLADFMGAHGIVTGEALGQVSSQTLLNLGVIDEATKLVVLRPLISFCKEEIIQKSRELGTYDLSSKIKEFCQLNLEKPSTGAKLERIKQQEEAIDHERLLSDVYKTHQLIKLKDLSYVELVRKSFFVDKLDADCELMDVRTKEEFMLWHPQGARHVDSRLLMDNPEEFLNKKSKYVFYCEASQISALVAEKLSTRGYKALALQDGVGFFKNKK